MATRRIVPRIESFVAGARRAVLATIDPTAMPRLVPICFVAVGAADRPVGSLVLYSAIDEKPKRDPDPLALARVRDLLARPTAAVLVDRWSEDWRRLGWVRLACRGEVLAPDAAAGAEHAGAVAALRAKYPQYQTQRLESRPLIRLTCSVAGSWGVLDEDREEET